MFVSLARKSKFICFSLACSQMKNLLIFNFKRAHSKVVLRDIRIVEAAVRFCLGPHFATLQIFGAGKRSLLAAPAGAARRKFSQKIKRLDKIVGNNFVQKHGVRSDFLNKRFNFVKIVFNRFSQL